MKPFRKIVNGPPCELSQASENNFRFNNDNISFDTSHEGGLIDWMCSFSNAQEESRTTEELFQNWVNYFQHLGVSFFNYSHVHANNEGEFKRLSVVAHFGLPEPWKQASFVQEKYESNPLVSYAFAGNEVLKLSDLKHFKSRSSRVAKYYNSIDELDLSEGYGIPIYSAGLSHGFFALGIAQPHQAFDKRQLGMVTWACQISHDKYIDLMAKEKEQSEQQGLGAKLKTSKSAQLSDKQAVAKVISELEKVQDAAQAQSKGESYRFQIAAALKFGYREPFSKEQSELNYFLMKIIASQQVAEDAWNLYHMLRRMDDS